MHFAIYLVESGSETLVWHGSGKAAAMKEYKTQCNNLVGKLTVEMQHEGELTVLDTFDPELLTSSEPSQHASA